jgi:citrate synthase
MAKLRQRLEQLIPQWRAELEDIKKLHGKKVIDTVTIEQVYGGMRGIRGLVCDTSEVPPDKGMMVRGIPVKELADKTPEEIFYLLLTGEHPDAEGIADIKAEFAKRSVVPGYVWDVLEAMPKDSHPMAMFNTAVLVLERESKFRAAYDAGAKKSEYWLYTYEDSLDLLAKLPAIAAFIYRLRFDKGPRIEGDQKLDWSANYVKMLGLPDPGGDFVKLMTLYLVLHCDHESGNVSAFTSAVVSSALSDVYYALSAGLNGLAGPLHGLANQECLAWVLETIEKFGGVPSKEGLEKYAWETLNAGRVVPGYGHAVLRITDPRFDCFLDFGNAHFPNDPVFATVARVFDVVPEVLRQVQKIKDPWPNVDAGSGALLYHYGLKEFPYYTVLFAVSRAMGICAQSVVARAYGLPITRPKSSTTKWLKAKGESIKE